MSSEVMIGIDNLSKKFCRSLKKSLWYGVKDICSEIAIRGRDSSVLRPAEFWALKDVSLELRRGEMIGLVGENGSGKSTLLKLLNGLIKPSAGRIDIGGSVQALIELGAGFNPILTGRENIEINAAVLGISKRRIEEALPRIIEFSGLHDFMDTPVAHYSSGMKARLGFAVATEMNPDVLLIDEVLAVGDIAFQEKCMRRMDALRNSDKAIVFVTHSLYQVEALCDTVLWLDHGKVVQYGKAQDVVRSYLDAQESRIIQETRKEGNVYEGRVTEATRAYFNSREKQQEDSKREESRSSKELLAILKVDLLNSNEEVVSDFPFGESLTVKIHYHAFQKVDRPLFNLRFFYKNGSVFEASMLIDGYGADSIEGDGSVECNIPDLPLTPGVYSILLFVRSSEGIKDIAEMRTVAHFRVTDKNLDKVPLRGPMAINHLRQGSPVYLPRTWRFYSCNKLTATLESNYDESK